MLLLLISSIALETATSFARYVPFLIAERFVAAEPRQPFRNIFFNLSYTPWYHLGTYLLLPITTSLVVGSLVARTGGPLLPFHLWIDTYLGSITCGLLWLVTFDLFYYCFHRLQHTSPLLWRLHKLHHLEPSLNVTTTLRHHWLEEPLRVFFILAPMTLLFDLTPHRSGVVGLAIGLWGTFIHSNLRIHLGPLARIIVGPQGHRLHHSIQPQHHDRNFAAFFSFWDRMFGTYRHPQRGEFPPTGVAGELPPDSVLAANLLPFNGLRSWSKSYRF